MNKSWNMIQIEHLEKICHPNFVPKVEVVENHLNRLPQKLYKFRELNSDNIKSLKNDYIWLSQAIDFDDQSDTRVKYDINKYKYQINRLIRKYVPILAYRDFRRDLSQRGIKFGKKLKLNYYQTKIEELLTKTGKPNYKELKKFLVEIGTPNKKVIELIKFYKLKFAEALTKENVKKLSLSLGNALKKANEKLQVDFYHHSFAGNHKFYKMWETYAGNGTGYCIEYDLHKLRDLGLKKFLKIIYIFPMRYGKRKGVNVTDLLELSMLKYLNRKNDDLFAKVNFEVAREILTKEISYDKEDEWRMLLEAKRQHCNELFFPCVSAVYLGQSMAADDENKLIEIAKSKQIKVYKRKFDEIKSEFYFEEYSV